MTVPENIHYLPLFASLSFLRLFRLASLPDMGSSGRNMRSVSTLEGICDGSWLQDDKKGSETTIRTVFLGFASSFMCAMDVVSLGVTPQSRGRAIRSNLFEAKRISTAIPNAFVS